MCTCLLKSELQKWTWKFLRKVHFSVPSSVHLTKFTLLGQVQFISARSVYRSVCSRDAAHIHHDASRDAHFRGRRDTSVPPWPTLVTGQYISNFFLPVSLFHLSPQSINSFPNSSEGINRAIPSNSLVHHRTPGCRTDLQVKLRAWW